MSAHVWKAGDLAKCVDDAGGFCPVEKIPAEIKKGKVYRVQRAGVSVDHFGKEYVIIGLVGFDWSRGFNTHYFRPILPAEPAFTDAMRSLKPRVDA